MQNCIAHFVAGHGAPGSVVIGFWTRRACHRAGRRPDPVAAPWNDGIDLNCKIAGLGDGRASGGDFAQLPAHDGAKNHVLHQEGRDLSVGPIAPTERNHAQTLNGSVRAIAMFSAPRANMSAAHA